jgi:RNA polymerase sigma-70 factor (ECF subfamily)
MGLRRVGAVAILVHRFNRNDGSAVLHREAAERACWALDATFEWPGLRANASSGWRGGRLLVVTAARLASPTNPDDAELVGAMARGDADALAALYDRHSALLYAAALRVLRSEGDAEDLLHDVFLEVWAEAGRFDPSRGSVRTWLLVKMRGRALDRLRRDRRRTRLAEQVDDVERTLVRVALSAEASAERRLTLREALIEVPEDVRVVVESLVVLGLTARELAETLGLPEGTVRSRLARGLSVLERVLSDEIT